MLTNQMADVEKMALRMGPKFEVKGYAVNDLKTILSKRQATFNQALDRAPQQPNT